CRVEHYWPPVADRCPRTVGMEGPGNGAGRMWVRRPPIKIGGSIYYASIYDAWIALWMECGLSYVSCNRRKDTYDLFGHRADRDDDPPGRAAHPAADRPRHPRQRPDPPVLDGGGACRGCARADHRRSGRPT